MFGWGWRRRCTVGFIQGHESQQILVWTWIPDFQGAGSEGYREESAGNLPSCWEDEISTMGFRAKMCCMKTPNAGVVQTRERSPGR